MSIDRQQVIDELATEWLDGLDGAELEEGRRLLGEVVDDWAREADSTPDPGAVLAIQRDELAARGRGQDAAGRLHVLRSRVVERRVDRLSAATYALGKAILDGSADDEAARTQGKAYLHEAEELAGELDALGVAPGDPVPPRARRRGHGRALRGRAQGHEHPSRARRRGRSLDPALSAGAPLRACGSTEICPFGP